jgi:PKD repeat protein
MRLNFTITAIVSLFFLSSNAQKTIKKCYSSEMNEKAIQMQPELKQVIEQLDAYSRTYVASENDRSVNKIIPVVFHVIHNYGSENISKEQILSAMDVLNKDYQLLNEDQTLVDPDFQGLIANVGLEFRLAKLDPQGNCTEGITRTVSPLTFSADDNVKQLISWPTNKYLNVWVVENISFSAGGYAYLPGNAPSPSLVNDGIVVINSQLGTTGTSNGGNLSVRTLTHEVGHFFNLRHTWGGTNTPGVATNCDVDDGVTDTPNTIGVDNSSCNRSSNTCGTPLGDNVENYMDYSSCPRMFTTGQSNRMQASLNSTQTTRRNLWQPANLTATGVLLENITCSPIADFTADNTGVCANSTIDFSDLSYNAEFDNTWTFAWTFEGGNPATSTLRNPSVTYSQPGIYNVSLVVTNSAGNSSKSKQSYITINTVNPILVSPVFESFENASFPNNGSDITTNWQFETSYSNLFVRNTAAKVTGNASLRYTRAVADLGIESSVISPSISFANVTSPANLTFKLAYAQRATDNTTKLEVFISRDCGKTWIKRFSRIGDALATTASFVNSTFVPTDAQWELITVNVSQLAAQSHGLIKFSVTEGDGNNLYLEDINIVSAPLSISSGEIDEEQTTIFPNPGNGDATFAYQLLQPMDVSISIHDISGRLIGTKKIASKNLEGKIQLSEISNSALMKGSYIVSLSTNNSSYRKLWVNE